MVDVQRSTLNTLLKEHMSNFGVSCLSADQCTALKHMQKQEDCFVVLPTGSGKSLLFHLAPWLLSSSSSTTTPIQAATASSK